VAIRAFKVPFQTILMILSVGWEASVLGFAQEPGRIEQPVGLSGANLPAQKIGPNDLIAVSVYQSPELSRTVRVSNDGVIRLPMLNEPIRAENLMPSELDSAIADALTAGGILVSPIVTVTVVEYRSRPISVAGAVKAPVTFQASGEVTLLEAITRAGGLNEDAGREILVSRTERGPDGAPKRLTQRISVKSLIDAADPGANLRLTGGEEIRVPELGRVFVVGNVKKPGRYPVDDANQTTVLKVLALAEGLTPFSSARAYVVRRNSSGAATSEVPVELKSIMQRKSPDVALVAGDILYIPDNSGRRATLTALEKITGFASATASGILIWGRP